MGQRSQIYIRYNVTDDYGKNYKGLIARYFQWNYGERMVSRARYIIEEIKDEFMEYKFLFGDSWKIKKLEHYCDVNFDMKDITLSSDIIKEVEEDCNGDTSYLFGQDNNDGQLFIDVTNDGIKYCFMRYYNEGEPMDAEQYMKWNCEREDHPDWHTPYKYMNEKTIQYTEENIKTIGKIATAMTAEEIEEFVNADYDYLFVPEF